MEFDGKNLHVTMIPNPSHLEASHPVIMGKARSRYQTRKQAFYNPNDSADSTEELNKILTIQVHGDAAMAGQVNISSCILQLSFFWKFKLYLQMLYETSFFITIFSNL